MSRARRFTGFTLVEILVVLAIAGLLTGIALPRMQRMIEAMELASQRRAIIAQINGLGYRAFVGAQPLRLASVPDPDTPSSAQPALEIPRGWRLEAERPIEYRLNGLCGGGRVTLLSPANDRYAFDLKPPMCQIEGPG